MDWAPYARIAARYIIGAATEGVYAFAKARGWTT